MLLALWTRISTHITFYPFQRTSMRIIPSFLLKHLFNCRQLWQPFHPQLFSLSSLPSLFTRGPRDGDGGTMRTLGIGQIHMCDISSTYEISNVVSWVVVL